MDTNITNENGKNEWQEIVNLLEQAATSIEFLKTQCDILADINNSPVARLPADLQIKNHLTSKDNTISQQCQQGWLSFPESIREYMKKKILGGTENTRPSCAEPCVADVANVELPADWNSIHSALVKKVTEGISEMERVGDLEAIAYICQHVGLGVLEHHFNQILTAIIHVMKKEEDSNHDRLAATTALLNILEFTKANFEKDIERNYIMEVVFEATQSSDAQICVAALQCLVKIMSLYYQYMEPYMTQALFPITLEAIRSINDQIGLQGIKFWLNVCEEESDISTKSQEAQDAGRDPTRTSKHYARGALQYLTPLLMEKLTKQDELDDDDNWSPAKSARNCLILLATCCKHEIAPFVIPFIEENIKSPNWRNRNAAIMVFGSIISGFDANTLKQLVEQAMPTLIQLMYDKSDIVRSSAAWAIGRICDIIPEAGINTNYLKPLLESLLQSLKSEPRVAANVCRAFIGLSDAAYGAAETTDGKTPETYCLSQYFSCIINQLLEITDRPDSSQAKLRAVAYESLRNMIKNSPNDCYVAVQKTLTFILDRVNQDLQMENHICNGNDRLQFSDLQSLQCATLQSVLRKCKPEDAPKISDAIMTTIQTMFASSSGKVGGVQEYALKAVSTLVDLLGEQFIMYMEAFKTYLFMGLRNYEEYQVCCAAVGLTGGLCRGLKAEIFPYCDEIMTLLLENLSNPNLHHSVKPEILSTFGDMALSIGTHFSKYLPFVLQMLVQASQVQVDPSDYDMLDYLNKLRKSVLEAYTGITQGLRGVGKISN